MPSDAWKRRKSASLLQRLALERRLLKEQAIEFLWPEGDPTAGANNLYRTLYDLRHTLDAHLGTGAAEALFTFEDSALILKEAVWVDAQAFERLTQSSNTASAGGSQIKPDLAAIQNLQAAIDLYAGDLLPDELYAEWTIAPREWLRKRYRESSLLLATYYHNLQDYSRALSLLNPLLTYDAADEFVHRELMRTYALAGRRHDALRQYQICVKALATDLDVPPEPETAALYSQILNGELAAQPLPRLPNWAPLVPSPKEDRNTPLVGREAELEVLCALLRTGWQGRGKTILLAGESGVGKTRLAYEVLRVTASEGMTTLLGAAYEQEGQLPYQPFIEAFNYFLVKHQRPFEENPIIHYKRLGTGDLQQEQWALFNTVSVFLTKLISSSQRDSARPTPVVLLVDDLHAADDASIRLFHYLARQAQSAPIMLIATYRADGVSESSSFENLLNALYRGRLAETFTLTPLAPSAVAQALSDILDARHLDAKHPGNAVSPALAKAVFDITEGNPFYIQEIAHALLKSGDIEVHAGQWHLRPEAELRIPIGLAGLLRQRVARLGPKSESALIAAAVLGREFSFDVLRHIVELSDGELLDALDAGLNGYLLAEREEGYRFRHPLIRRVLYEGLSRVRRARLHTRAAEAIKAVHALQPGGLETHSEALAFHYDLSDRRDQALPYLIKAGQRAADTFAIEVAVGYFERALGLMEALGRADSARWWMVLESLGWWQTTLANTPRAVAYFEQALALPPGNGWESRRQDRVRIHCGAAMALITAGNTAEAEAHLQAAMDEVDAQDHASEYADLLYNMAQLYWHRNEYKEAFEAAQRSLAVAEHINDPTAIARAYEMLALACHSLGEWQAGIRYEEQRTALAGPGLDVSDAFDVHL
ncbi:MAG: AAA family ATPase [Chloroflexi bacterium]|nr:AAA family ATPase [Chloroflexota bacterium]